MDSIQDIVERAVETKYLSLDDQNRLRYLLQQTHYGADEIRAFCSLQKAAMGGLVTLESQPRLARLSS
ncbi:MAG: hypothetical protein ACFE0J_21970 [Elainellaceae cyanobacterium]